MQEKLNAEIIAIYCPLDLFVNSHFSVLIDTRDGIQFNDSMRRNRCMYILADEGIGKNDLALLSVST